MASKHIIVTLGSTRYRAERPWPTPDLDLKGLSDVTVLTDGRVAALRRHAPALLIFAPGGGTPELWDVPALVAGHYLRPRRDGGLLIADFDGHQILALDHTGQCVWTLGDPARPNWGEPFNHPTSATEGPDGTLYVTDGYGNSCLHRFDSQRRLLGSIGNPGVGPAEFSTPHDVIVTRDRRVLVVDRENNRIQIFSEQGTYVDQIGNLYKPMALAEMPDGSILVTDHTPRLHRFAPDGALLGRCRTLSTVAHGVAAAPDGSIYLAEMAPDMLTRLTPVD